MSELNIKSLNRAFYDRLYGRFQPKLAIHPESHKRLDRFFKEMFDSDDKNLSREYIYKGVQIAFNSEVPQGILRVDREWTDEDVDIWIASGDNWDLLKWKLAPVDLDLPEVQEEATG